MANQKLSSRRMGVDIMKFLFKENPRKFIVGENKNIEIKDLGDIYLDKNEQVTFITQENRRHDFVSKDWGFYATPSINGRLKREGFITALVKNENDKIYIMVVEKNKKELFLKYCTDEKQTIIKWLNDYSSKINKEGKAILDCSCKHEFKELIFEYNKPPVGETDFGFKKNNYYRKYEKCKKCNHFFSVHNLDMENFYQDKYVNSTYENTIDEKFKKIISLPKNQSDNICRVKRVFKFTKKVFNDKKNIKLIDIGSGLGVFPYEMNNLGINTTALDPDPKSAKHLRDQLGIETIQGDLFKLKTNKKFDIATLNKVLEHVFDPVKMLSKTSELIHDKGLIYIEVPDGEMASKHGKNREEFFIEHHHVFSFNSLILMSESSGLIPLEVKRIEEPSGKYTLIAFLKKI